MHREDVGRRGVQRSATDHGVKKMPSQRSRGNNLEGQMASETLPEAAMRRRAKCFYLSLLALSIVVIIVFAVLLKIKLKTIKEPVADPEGQYLFEENPRITFPRSEYTDGGEDRLEDRGETAEDADK